MKGGDISPRLLDFACAIALIFWLNQRNRGQIIVFTLTGTISCVVVIKRLHALLISEEQIFKQLHHWNLVAREASRVIVGVG